MSKCKRIGILTSGGDCPGLNAVIRAVVKCATRLDWEVLGVPYGTDGFMAVDQGLCNPDDLKLNERGYDIPGILQGLDVLQFLSGSVLGSLSKGNPADPEVEASILSGYKKMGLDALIVIGGDGSLEIIYNLALKGHWNMIAVPKTIDNDVPFTERSVGFDTAVNKVTECIYDLTFTAASHDRVMVVQVMGRDAGHLALHAGIAGGADAILIPELSPIITDDTIDDLCRHLAKLRDTGRKFALVVLSEGVMNRDGVKEKYIGDTLAKEIQAHCHDLCETGQEEFCTLNEVDTRCSVLGHIQRSGTPTSADRLLATAFGKKAVDLLREERFDRLVVWRDGKVEAIPIDEVMPILRQCHREDRCPGPVKPNNFMVQVAKSLGIYVGDFSKAAEENGKISSVKYQSSMFDAVPSSVGS